MPNLVEIVPFVLEKMKSLQRTDRRTDNRQSEKLTSFQLRWANKFTDYGYLWSILLTFNSKFILLSLNLVQRKTRTYSLFGLTHTGIDFNIKIHCKMQSSNILQYIYILLAHHMVIVHPRLVDCIPLSSLMASQHFMNRKQQTCSYCVLNFLNSFLVIFVTFSFRILIL